MCVGGWIYNRLLFVLKILNLQIIKCDFKQSKSQFLAYYYEYRIDV